MISDLISVGDKLTLQKLKTKEFEIINDKVYMSQLLDYIGDDKANISMPIMKGRIIPLSIGDKYMISFYTNKGLFQCKSIITDRFKNNNIYIHEIQFLSELEKYQRRQYYRLDCIIDFTYHIITELETILTKQIQLSNFQNEMEKNNCINTLDEYKNIWQNGTIIDISGGGARFNSNHLFEQVDGILMNIDLEATRLVLNAKVISSNKMIHRQGYYEHRVKFINISKEDREAIIKFIFEEDRRKRRKEKGLN